WGARPETRNLPGWWEFLPIVLLTSAARRTPPERALVRAAARYHLTRAAVVVVLLGVASWGASEWGTYARAQGQVNALAIEAKTREPFELLALTGVTGSRSETVVVPGRYRWLLRDRLQAVRRDNAPGTKAHDIGVLLLALLGFDLDDDQVAALGEWVLGLDFRTDRSAGDVPSSHFERAGNSGEVCAVLLPSLQGHRREVFVQVMEATLAEAPAGEPQERDRQAREQANAAVARLPLGRPERTWRPLGPGPDPPV